jgi:hypothetical protein
MESSSVETVSRYRNCLFQGFLHLTWHRLFGVCVLGVMGLAVNCQKRVQLLMACMFSDVMI